MDILKTRAIILFVIAFLNLGLSLLLWYRSQSDRAKLWLGFTALFSGAYAFFCGATYFFWDQGLEVSVLWYKTTWLGVLMLPCFMIFTYYFAGKTKYINFIIVAIYIPALLIAYFALTTDYFVKSLLLRGMNISSLAGSLDPVGRIFIFLCLVISIGNLLKDYFRADAFRKMQLRYFIIGTSIFALSGIITTAIIPFIIKESPYYDIAAYLSFVWIGLTAYAILKYRLMDIKTVATELFTYGISLIMLIRMLLSETLQDWLINGIVFIFLLIFGILLIRSVLKEVRQRENMEKMAKDLEKAYEAEKAAKEVVERARAEDEALLGSIGDGVVAINKDGEVMFVNRVAEEMLGFRSGQVVGRPYEEVLRAQNERGEDLADGKNPLDEALNSGKKIITDATNTPEKTVYFVKQDKTRFPVAVTVAPVILQGRTIGAINVFRDVTIERQIDKSKSEFVSLASHQLRTPLTTIKWYSEMLMDKKAGVLNSKQKEYLNVIYDGNQRMVKLIDIMLDVSRLDAGKVKIHEELVNIKKIAEIIIGEEKLNIKEHKQKFIFECEEKNPETLTDPNQLRIVFQNVISNAVRYTPAGGKIVCNIKKQGDDFLFSVKDSGIGIPRNQQNRIFEKLFRADNAFSHKPDGNGLGLYAAKATIENLGGKIWFESKEGKGTTFYITLPLKQ